MEPVPTGRLVVAVAEGVGGEEEHLARSCSQSQQAEEEEVGELVGTDDLLGSLGDRAVHSDANVVVDASGNMAVLLHSINTLNWGTTGIFVDGVSIPDSGACCSPKTLATTRM